MRSPHEESLMRGLREEYLLRSLREESLVRIYFKQYELFQTIFHRLNCIFGRPFCERRRRAYGASSLKGCTRGRDTMMASASPFLCPAARRDRRVSCRRFVVTKPVLVWFYRIPTRRLDTKRHHARAQRVKQTIRYASPRMERH